MLRKRGAKGGSRMKSLKAGIVAAAVVAATFACVPIALADKCPLLVGPDWSGGSLSPEPARLLSISDVYHARMIYDPLVGVDSGMQPIPWLAVSWEPNSAATEWTFHLRPDVKFHDGSPLTADDVVYTFRRLLDPKTA